MPCELQEIALFDHNQLDKTQAQFLGGESLVSYVMDHHVDNNCFAPQQLKYKNVKLIGSCCSILTQEIMAAIELFPDDFSPTVKINLAYFLGAPILLDTSNFASALKDNKWTHED
jgi:inorganic pyrophosphatase/exopolyphosphatase